MKKNENIHKTRKKKKHIGRWILLIALLAAAAGIFYRQGRQGEAQEDPNAEESVVLEENQSWLYLQIDTIEGNEMQASQVDTAGELKTYMIPVGTDVVTRLGNVTTFSRLAAGDVIHCLMERTGGEDVILKIWIEE